MRLPSCERGFALPLAIFIVTITTLMLTAAFVRTAGEQRMANSSGSTIDALAVARSGLGQYLAYYDSLQVRPADGDSLRMNVNGGYADVVAELVRVPVDTMDPHLYIVRSRGTVIEPVQGSDPQAERLIAQFANWVQGGIQRVAAHTALNGIWYDSLGAALEINGNDACASKPNITGFRAPSLPWDSTPDLSNTFGVPPMVMGGPIPTVVNELGIDWDGIQSGSFEYDYTSVLPGSDYFTYFIDDNLDLTNAIGTGLLMVTGELRFHGSYNRWNGLVLVGERLTNDADSTVINGVLVTGLDMQIPQPVSPNDLDAFGTLVRVTYNSCDVGLAVARFRGFTPLHNAWIDNWATY